MQERVLIVDDEAKIAKMVADYLAASGYETSVAQGGDRALAEFNATSAPPACVILDINMPGRDGLEVAREIRKTSAVPIIFLSARAEEADKVAGLELGGDDYVVKPFSLRELLARVKAVSRRSSQSSGDSGLTASGKTPWKASGGDMVIERGDLVLDIEKRSLRRAGSAIALTAVQFDILAFLMRRPGRVYTRAEILDATAGIDFEGYERTLDAHIKNLRKALGDDPARPRYIATLRGVGYKFVEGER